jgi:hypothetical protein
MTYILDTGHLSVLDQDAVEAVNLGRRWAAVPPADDPVLVGVHANMRMVAYLDCVRMLGNEVRGAR